jgi:hypothetical protein
MRVCELEVTKKYGFSLQQAWQLTRDQYAKELIGNFEVVYQKETGKPIKLQETDPRHQFLTAFAQF